MTKHYSDPGYPSPSVLSPSRPALPPRRATWADLYSLNLRERTGQRVPSACKTTSVLYETRLPQLLELLLLLFLFELGKTLTILTGGRREVGECEEIDVVVALGSSSGLGLASNLIRIPIPVLRLCPSTEARSYHSCRSCRSCAIWICSQPSSCLPISPIYLPAYYALNISYRASLVLLS